MSVETKIHFYKDGEDKGIYNVYNGDCDGKDTFWCSLSEWDGLMKLQMVNNEVLYFNGNDEEMFVFEEGEEEYNWIKNYINPKLKMKNDVNKKDKILNMLMTDNKWHWNHVYKKKIKKSKQITYDEQKELIKKLKEKIKELNKGNKRKLKTENNKLKKENEILKEKLKQIHQLIFEAKEESLLSPTQYHHEYKDGTDGVKWTMINKATKILSDIRKIINV